MKYYFLFSLSAIFFDRIRIINNKIALADAITHMTATALFPVIGLDQSTWNKLNVKMLIAIRISVKYNTFIILKWLTNIWGKQLYGNC